MSTESEIVVERIIPEDCSWGDCVKPAKVAITMGRLSYLVCGWHQRSAVAALTTRRRVDALREQDRLRARAERMAALRDKVVFPDGYPEDQRLVVLSAMAERG